MVTYQILDSYLHVKDIDEASKYFDRSNMNETWARRLPSEMIDCGSHLSDRHNSGDFYYLLKAILFSSGGKTRKLMPMPLCS